MIYPLDAFHMPTVQMNSTSSDFSCRAFQKFLIIRNAPDRVRAIQDLMISIEDDSNEGEFLDFKAGTRLELKSDSVKEIWSKALSAFANCGGGILIWGVDKPQTASATESPVKNPQTLKERLQQLTPGATDPPLMGVEYESIVLSERSEEGFLACYIPSGPDKAYKALHAKPKDYYIRVADNSLPCPRELLRRLFYPEINVFMKIGAILKRERGFTSGLRSHRAVGEIRLPIWLHVRGEATADDVLLVVENAPNGTTWDRFWHDVRSAAPGVALCASRPIHPLEDVVITQLVLGWYGDDGCEQRTAEPDLTISVFCRNQLRRRFRLRVPQSVPVSEAWIEAERLQ